MSNPCIEELESIRDFFNRGTAWLTETDAQCTPAEGTYTATEQIAHVAQTVDWFVEGGFGSGFRMDFEVMNTELREVENLAAARQWFEDAMQRALASFGQASPEQLAETLPADCIMGPVPKAHLLSAISDHTAHHRGALTVYARVCGKVAAMPYMDMPEG